MSALTELLGQVGEDPACRVVTEGVAVHWWANWPTEGDLCLCGTLPYVPPTECEDPDP